MCTVHADTPTPLLGAPCWEHHHLGGTGLTWARMGLAVCCVVQEGPGTESESERQGRWAPFCWAHLRAAPHLGEPPRAWATQWGDPRQACPLLMGNTSSKPPPPERCITALPVCAHDPKKAT